MPLQQRYEMRAEFMATPEQAKELQSALEAAAAVYFDPTEANASRLFEMGARAVVSVARAEL